MQCLIPIWHGLNNNVLSGRNCNGNSHNRLLLVIQQYLSSYYPIYGLARRAKNCLPVCMQTVPPPPHKKNFCFVVNLQLKINEQIKQKISYQIQKYGLFRFVILHIVKCDFKIACSFDSFKFLLHYPSTLTFPYFVLHVITMHEFSCILFIP